MSIQTPLAKSYIPYSSTLIYSLFFLPGHIYDIMNLKTACDMLPTILVRKCCLSTVSRCSPQTLILSVCFLSASFVSVVSYTHTHTHRSLFFVWYTITLHQCINQHWGGQHVLGSPVAIICILDEMQRSMMKCDCIGEGCH